MFEHVLYFNVNDRRMPKISKCAFHIKLDDVLTNEISIDPRPLFTHKTTSPTLEKLMLNFQKSVETTLQKLAKSVPKPRGASRAGTGKKLQNWTRDARVWNHGHLPVHARVQNQ